MNNKNISSQSGQLLNYFNNQDKYYFDIGEAKKVLSESTEGAIRDLLSKMSKRGLLMRIKKGLYHIIPYEKDAGKFIPDWHLLAEPLTQGTLHYIGYYSALQLHNLITQPSLKEQIVVAKQIRPSRTYIKGVQFQFIFHNTDHFFGVEKVWVNNFDKASCSDLEKTIIDCLFKPDYAGGIVEVARAVYLSRKKINYSKLLEYAQKFNSQAVIKRLGFILETLEIETEISRQLRELKTASYVVLDPELPKQGKNLSSWSIQQNLDSETIKAAIYT